MSDNHREPGRGTPAKGVHIYSGQPNWVFLTVCTEKKERWLAQPDIHKSLHQIWEHTAKAWLVSDYTLLPDHLHLFCAPHDLQFTIERWIGFWKDRLADKQFHPHIPCFPLLALDRRWLPILFNDEINATIGICSATSGVLVAVIINPIFERLAAAVFLEQL